MQDATWKPHETSISRKRHGATWAFILKRIKETLPPKAYDAQTPSAELRIHRSESLPDRRSSDKSEVKSQPTLTSARLSFVDDRL
jgi:hypothetical protein